MIDLAREKVQQDAIEAALNSMVDGKMRCTLELATGLGKTFIAFHLIKKLQPKTVLFLAETTMREGNIKTDMEKFKLLYNYDIVREHEVSYACYQSAYKWKDTFYDLVVCDEQHDSGTEQYYKYYLNNQYTHLLGLSATIDNRTVFEIDGKEYTKKTLLETIAPIVFTYTLKQGQADNTSRKLRIFVIRHEMDKIKKNVKVEMKGGSFMQSEQDYYNYCNQRFTQSIWSKERSDFLVRYWANKRASVLYNMPSKTRDAKKLLQYLDRTIVFSNSIDQLVEICPTVSSKNDIATNIKIVTDFNNSKLNTIGSFKMLQQGMNLNGLNNVVLLSYYSKPKNFIQCVGRCRKADIPANIFVFMTYNSQEEVWFSKIMEDIDMPYITCHGIDDCIEKFTNSQIAHGLS